MRLAIAILAVPVLTAAQTFSVERTVDHGVELIRLVDHQRGIEVDVVPSLGNRATAMKVHGKNVLFFPDEDLASAKRHPGLNGVPFLAPWANRLDEPGFWANGKHYLLNSSLHNYSGGSGLPIHGLLSSSDLWQVAEMKADGKAAWFTSRLAFWKYPDLMAQWPFAHEYEMTYRLADGVLEVRMTVRNLGAEPMPLSLGFHPYYRLPDSARDQWTVSMPASKAVLADSRLIPTGELAAVDLPNPLPLKGHLLDNGFTNLERDTSGRAHFRIESGSEAVEVTFGPKYPVAVLWAPPSNQAHPQEFLCIEPMSAVTDGLNLNHRGLYDALQTVAPGATWSESFWIRPVGL